MILVQLHLPNKKTASITISNNGQLPSIFSIQADQAFLTISPNKGVVNGGEQKEIVISIQITESSQRLDHIVYPKILNSVTINFASNKSPFVFLVSANYVISPIGMPIEFLYRLPAPLSKTPPSLFIYSLPLGIFSAPIMNLPKPDNVPFEIECLLKFLKKTPVNQKFFTQQLDSANIYNALNDIRNRQKINKKYEPEIILNTLLTFVRSFYEPLVPLHLLKNWQEDLEPAESCLSHVKFEFQQVIREIVVFLKKNQISSTIDHEQLCKIIGVALVQENYPCDSETEEKCKKFVASLTRTY